MKFYNTFEEFFQEEYQLLKFNIKPFKDIDVVVIACQGHDDIISSCQYVDIWHTSSDEFKENLWEGIQTSFNWFANHTNIDVKEYEYRARVSTMGYNSIIIQLKLDPYKLQLGYYEIL